MTAHGVGIVGGEQRLYRHVHRVGVGDQRRTVAIAEARGLGLQMQPFGTHRVEPGKLEALEDVEDEQRDDPLAVGRALVDVEAPVVRADGLHRLRLEGGEVVRRHQAAVVLKVGHNVVGDGAAIEGLSALLRDQTERLRQRRQAMEIAGSGRPPAGQVDSARVLAGVELPRGARPVVRCSAMDDVSLLA